MFQAQALFGRYTISTELSCEVLENLLLAFVVVFYVPAEGAVNLNGILPFGFISWAGQKDCGWKRANVAFRVMRIFKLRLVNQSLRHLGGLHGSVRVLEEDTCCNLSSAFCPIQID